MKFKLMTLVVVLTLVSVSYTGASNTNQLSTDEELDLLLGEVIFEIKAIENTNSSFNIFYAVPSIYGYQSPIILEIRENTTAKIINYKIENDTNYPNQVINFTIDAMKKDENATFYIDLFVLVKNNKYQDLPRYVKIPKEYELPEETKIWLEPANPIQSDNIKIKIVARLLRGFSFNLIKLARRTSFFTGKLLNGEYSGLQDALSTLERRGGVCTGRANLGTALFRANSIPSRVITVMPTWSKDMLFDMHYISEYYCPGYGWVFAETSLGKTPYEPKNQIVMRVSYPEDDNKAGDYGGVALWFWTNNPKVVFPYQGPYVRRAWIEKEIQTNEQAASPAFDLTKDIYRMYTKYVGMELFGENQQHFDNATTAQKNAIDCFVLSDLDGYYNNLTYANNEYLKIV